MLLLLIKINTFIWYPELMRCLMSWKGTIICQHMKSFWIWSRPRPKILTGNELCCLLLSYSTPNPKIFFCSNKSLHRFETHIVFLPPFNSNLDCLQAVKVTKSGHHLLHDRASKGYGSIRGWMSQTSLDACLQRLSMMQISLWCPPRNRPIPLTCPVVQQMMARFRNFYNL